MEQIKKEKLWSKNFLILWQGQLVSTMGDAIYSIALGFWVLAVTGSTATMGLLMAASTLPGVLISPFAGVLIDRYNKKRLFVLMDILRGSCVTMLAIAALTKHLAIWMLFVVGILLSVGGALFGPGIQSTVPDLVPKSKIANANSLFSIVSTGSNMIGSVAGGVFYQAIGAPLLFLFDGLSFLFSGITLPFVKIPSVRQKRKTHILTDMIDGFHFMWKQKGLRIILTIVALLNFFSFIGIVLLLPMCEQTPYLGAGRYGIALACFMGGAMAGFMFMSIVSVKPKNKVKLYILSNIIFDIIIIIAINLPSFFIMAILLAITGFFNSIVNVILVSTVQESTPQAMRGKVMAFMNMTTSGLTPFAMALGGVLGEFFPVRAVITGAFLAVFVVTIPTYFAKSFKKYITVDYSKVDLETLYEAS